MYRYAAVLLTAALLIGCGALSKARPQAKPSAGMAVQSGDGIYVASVPAVDVQRTQSGLTAVLGSDLNQFPVGLPGLLVVNRWNGLPPGPHKDETRLLDNGGRVLQSDTSDLDGKDGVLRRADYSQACADALDTSHLLPGAYTIAVLLDGREYARYSIAMIQPPQSGSRRAATR